MKVEKELRNTGPEKKNCIDKEEEFGKHLHPEKCKQMDGLKKRKEADN
jgi:hypothetical protein